METAVAAVRTWSFPERWYDAMVGALAFLAVAPLAAASGGFFPTTWGWAALGFLWVAGMALVLRDEIVLSRLELVMLGGLTGLLALSALSLAWTTDIVGGMQEIQRLVIYIGAVAAAMLVARRSSGAAIAAGVYAGIVAVCAYSLATQLAPDRFGIYRVEGARLFEPVGYWNSLGIFAVIGLFVGAHFAARARSLWVRALAAAPLPLLASVLFFTLSRGSWICLALALVWTVAVEPRRVWLVTVLGVLAIAPAAAVLACNRHRALSSETFNLAQASSEGHRLAVILVGLCLVSGALVALFGLAEGRVSVSADVHRTYARSLVALGVFALILAFVEFGSPITIAKHVRNDFRTNSGSVGVYTPERMMNLSGNGRAQLWAVGAHNFARHPVAGSGVGSFATTWYQHRSIGLNTLWSHSLVVQVASELGIFGLVLLGLAVVPPLVNTLQHRQTGLAILSGGYVAFALHLAGDWDWQLPGVAAAGLLVGASIVAAEGAPSSVTFGPRRRAGLGGVLGIALLLATVALIGNLELRSARQALDRGEWSSAVALADSAFTWMPWSYEPGVFRGDGEVGLHQVDRARAAYTSAVDHGGAQQWELWLRIAEVSTGAGRESAAQKAVALNPEGVEIRQFCVEHRLTCR
jgi:O-antigen ligase